MAAFHKFNKELLTMNNSPLFGSFKMAVGSTGAVGTISQSKGNFISGIVRNSAGNYTVTLTRPYPHGYLNVIPRVHRNAITDAGCHIEYDVGSYSATAGTFVLRTFAAASSGTFASGTITCVANASMADTDFITVGDGIQAAKVYEYDKAADGVTGGRIAWAAGAGSAETVAQTLITAMAANQPSLTVTSNGSGVLTVTSKILGTAPNVTITENVANAGFLVTGLSGGVAPGTAVDPPSGSELHCFLVFFSRKQMVD
jgi:hypothetical protein